MTKHYIFSRICNSCHDGLLVYAKDPTNGIVAITCTCCHVTWPSPSDVRRAEGAMDEDSIPNYEDWVSATKEEIGRAGFAADVEAEAEW